MEKQGWRTGERVPKAPKPLLTVKRLGFATAILAASGSTGAILGNMQSSRRRVVVAAAQEACSPNACPQVADPSTEVTLGRGDRRLLEKINPTTTTYKPKPPVVTLPSSTTTTTVPPTTTTTLASFSPMVHAAGVIDATGYGADISHPNCSTDKIAVDFGIVGINHGKPFTTTSCLTGDTQPLTKVSAYYVNSSLPTYDKVLAQQDQARPCKPEDRICASGSYGYAMGRFSVQYAQSQGANLSRVWIDVETENSWQYDRPLENRASIQGEIDALKELGHTMFIGIYSTSYMYNKITGVGTDVNNPKIRQSWQNGLPNWVATGHVSPAKAAEKCQNNNFTAIINEEGKVTAGYTAMVQFVDDNVGRADSSPRRSLDRNLLCVQNLQPDADGHFQLDPGV